MKGSRLKYLLKVFSDFSVERTLRSLILFELLFLRNCRELSQTDIPTNLLIVQILLTKISTLWSCLGSLSFEAHSEVTAYLSYHLQALLSSAFFKVFNFALRRRRLFETALLLYHPQLSLSIPFFVFFYFSLLFSPFSSQTRPFSTKRKV